MRRLLPGLLLSCTFYCANGQVPEIIVVQDMKNDSLIHEAGYNWYVESISSHFSPRAIKDDKFKDKLAQIRSLSTPIFAVNIFLPGSLKVVGPSVNEKAVLDYADTVFQRCKAAGINMIIWGSAGSRRVPEGFDPAKAREQFISIARQVAIQASEYGIDIVLENLNHTETNFINRVSEIISIAEAVDQSNFKICVDIYHMLMEGERPDIISKTGKYLIHCDIAERDGRTPPGTHGDDFTPYLKALKGVGYKGKIALECNWKDVSTQLLSGRVNLEKQLQAVYK